MHADAGAIGVPEEYEDKRCIVAWKRYTLDEGDTLTTTANQQGQDLARGWAEMVADAWSIELVLVPFIALAPWVQRRRLMKIVIAIFLTLTACSPVLSQTPRIVTASQANGTYRYRQNEIKILALSHNKLRIQMDLTYEYKSAAGPTANTGEASGEATIENDTALFHPSDNQSCKITITFLTGNKIKVSEENTIECGFGMNVSSGGTYTKIKAGEPKFDEGR